MDIILELLGEAAREISNNGGRITEGDYIFDVTSLVTCPKQTYLMMIEQIDEERVIPLKVYAAYAAKLGSIYHSVLQAIIGGKSEVPVEEKFIHPSGCCTITIKGRADIVVRDSVVEIKTTSRDIMNGFGPNVSHVMQLVYYMKLLGKSKGFLLYANRAKPQLALIEVSEESYHGPLSFKDFVEKVVETIHKNAISIVDWLRSDKRPEEIPGYKGSWCRYCPFRGQCRNRVEWSRVFARVEFTKVRVYNA